MSITNPFQLQASTISSRNKKFRLVPTGQVLKVLRSDYNAMVEVGMFFGGTPASFEEMMTDIAALEYMLNS